MLARSQRLSRLDRARTELGRLVHSEHLTLRIAKGDHLAFAVVVSKKIAPKATLRNTLRRRASHALRKLLPKLKEPITGLLFFKKGSSEATFEMIVQELSMMFEKAGLLSRG